MLRTQSPPCLNNIKYISIYLPVLMDDAGQLKTGSGCIGERIDKFNKLMQIERALDSDSNFRW